MLHWGRSGHKRSPRIRKLVAQHRAGDTVGTANRIRHSCLVARIGIGADQRLFLALPPSLRQGGKELRLGNERVGDDAQIEQAESDSGEPEPDGEEKGYLGIVK
jgi:hypothetical protein